MGTVYARGKKLWVGFKRADGKTVYRATPYRLGEEEKAHAALREAERMVAAELRARGGAQAAAASGITLGEFLRPWLEQQESRGLHSTYTYRSIATHHLLPRFGSTPMADIRPRDVRAWVDEMRAAGHAPKSIRNRYGLLHRVFADAVMEELVASSPCVLTSHALPAKRDKDSDWRPTAVFTAAEAERIIHSPQVERERRVLYALLFLGGLRFGEAVALRWRHWDRTARPLTRIHVAVSFNSRLGVEKPTKTETPRLVPVHPVLETILRTWMAVVPSAPDDLILTGPETARARKGDDPHLTHQTAFKRWDADLDALGLRHRRMHDTRRTFISLCQAGGANRDHVTWITHGAPGDMLGDYTTMPWEPLCAAVSCLQVGPAPGSFSVPPTTSLLHPAKLADFAGEKVRRGWDSNPPRARAQESTGTQMPARTRRNARSTEHGNAGTPGHCSNVTTLGPADRDALEDVAELLAAILAQE